MDHKKSMSEFKELCKTREFDSFEDFTYCVYKEVSQTDPEGKKFQQLAVDALHANLVLMTYCRKNGIEVHIEDEDES